MHSYFPIAALFGAGAIAHPSFLHRHPHNKRDRFVTSFVGNEVLVEDFKDTVIVTVTAGQIPSSQPVAPPAVPDSPPVAEKLAVKAPPPVPERLVVDPPSVAPSSTTPIATPTQTPEASPSPPPVAAPAPAPATSQPKDSNTFWATSRMSPHAGGSGAKDVLTQANYWRQQWKGLPPYTWSSTLAKNAYDTAMNVEGKDPKNMMVHALYDGSSAQVEATGLDAAVDSHGLTPFERAFVGWLCEDPTSNLPCQCVDSSKYDISCNQNIDKEDPTGHSDIIKSYRNQIGCYYLEPQGGNSVGVWTCDFA